MMILPGFAKRLTDLLGAFVGNVLCALGTIGVNRKPVLGFLRLVGASCHLSTSKNQLAITSL
jgi:hypothetical protein